MYFWHLLGETQSPKDHKLCLWPYATQDDNKALMESMKAKELYRVIL